MMEINRECTELVLFHQTQPRQPDEVESYESAHAEDQLGYRLSAARERAQTRGADGCASSPRRNSDSWC